VSRIGATFTALRARGERALVAYFTAGDPSLDVTERLLVEVDRRGADVIELGVPFSDPLADGPVIQRATERALASGTTLDAVLALVADTRAEVPAPIVLFTYANPIARMGFEAFADRAAAAGVDGVLLLDVPIEEAADIQRLLDARGIDTIFLLSPTSTPDRIRAAARLGRGFLYAISRLGVTGVRDQLAEGAEALVGRIRRETALPLALGFGLSRPEHLRDVGRFADAAVVGSGLVQVIGDSGDGPELLPRVEAYVRWLTGKVPA
jgi:tryptophan synthase alpha chain